MSNEFLVGVGIAIVSVLLPYAVKDMPPFIAWGGIALGVMISALALLPSGYRPVPGAMLLYTAGAVSIVSAISLHLNVKAPLNKALVKPSVAAVASEPSVANETEVTPAPQTASAASSSKVERQITPTAAPVSPIASSEPSPSASDSARAELQRRRNIVDHIAFDYLTSHDGNAVTEAGRLDQAADYINEELKRRGEPWQFDRNVRRSLGYPPPLVGQATTLRRDISFDEGLVRARTGRLGGSAATEWEFRPQEFDEAISWFEQQARDGRLTVWGRPAKANFLESDRPYEKIEPDHWATHELDGTLVIDRRAATQLRSNGSTSTGYGDLMLSRAEIEGVLNG